MSATFNVIRLASLVFVLRMVFAPSFAEAFSAKLKGQSAGSTNWISSNLQNWKELDFIPVRVALSSGPATNRVIVVQFDHTKTSGGSATPGIQNLSQFVASPNVTITAGPTLTGFSGDQWSYTFTVNLTDNQPGFVQFRARLAAGAHNFPGSSLSMSGSPSLGTLQIAKPAAATGIPDLAVTKSGPASANAGGMVSYSVTYTNRTGTAATGVQVTDALPAVLSFGNCSGGCDVVGNEIIWDLGDLLPGDGGTLTYEVQLSAGALTGSSFQNSVSILSAEDDADYSNNTDSVTTTVASGCVPPSIGSDPQDQTVCDGATATLSVGANGTALSFQWRKNGGNIAGANDSSYTILSSTAVDAGMYDVIVSNACGMATSTAAELSVEDSQPPALGACPDNVTVSTDPASGSAIVTFDAPTASDNCGSVTVECSPASGSALGIGTTTVTCTATDSSGNTASCSFEVTVEDNEAPSLACAGDISVACVGAVPAPDTGSVIVSDNSGSATVVHVGDLSDGQSCPETITRTYRATDATGNEATCTQTILVHDDVAPMLTCPADVELECGGSLDPDQAGTATATDNCDANPTITHSDSAIEGGIARTWKATDACGNQATCVQTIRVVDTTAPTITPPADVAVAADSGACGATGVDLGQPVVSDTCGSLNVSNDAPTQFPVGTTIVTWTVTDGGGNTTTSQQAVTILDNEEPTVSCPANIAVSTDEGQSTASNVNLGEPTVNENCGSVTVLNDAPSEFPIGNTVVTWTIEDSNGNVTTCQQSITVGDNQPPSFECPGTVVVEAARQATDAVAHYDLPVASDNSGVESIECNPASGSAFPIGTNVVECVATDVHGNSASCAFSVIVEPPGGGQAGGASDVDLYVSKGVFQINWASHNGGVDADRLILKGKMNPRGCSGDLSGATVLIRVNGTEIGAATLDAKGRFTSPKGAAQAMRCKFSCLTGAFQFSISGVDLASLVGLPNVTAAGLAAVTVEIEIQDAGLAVPVVTGEFEFAYKSSQDRAAAGKFSFKKNRTLTGAYNLNKSQAKLTGAGYVFSTTGPILFDGSKPVLPTGDIIITVGNQTIVIPMSSLSVSAKTEATTIYTYNPGLGVVPGLAQFSINNKTKLFRLRTGVLMDTGLPMPGEGAPMAHDLEVSMDLLTADGNALAESIIEPKRKSPTAPAWKR
jgi:uncharacterized repeat protein (TIGR01451 family)